ncbi:MAG: sodium:solute symporter [bacterium]
MVRALDYFIIVSYLIIIAVIGLVTAGRNSSAKDYFLGAKSIPWWAVCFSIVAAETSALTFISIPGLAYLTNMNFLQVVIGYLIGRIIVAYVFLPAYFKGELTTAYAFLEKRFGIKSRYFASVVFLFTRTAADGVRLFATAIPIKLLLGISYPSAILIIMIIAIIYSIIGGVRSVIWVDVLQMIIYIGGAIITIYYSLNFLIPGGMQNFINIAWNEGKLQIFNLGSFTDLKDFFAKPYSLLGGIIGGAFLSMASHGADQFIIQRLFTTGDLKASRKAIIGSGIIVLIQFVLFLLVGVCLYVYYGKLDIRADEIFPKFIIEMLPAGISGLIIAGLLAAALSTLAGSINSLASSTMMDIFRIHPDKMKEPKTINLSRGIALFWAMALVGAALFFMNTTQSVVELALGISSFTYGGLLGTFLLGLIVKRANQEDALAAFTAGIFIMITVIALKLTAWTWFTLIGVSATLALGFMLSRINKKIKL